MNDDDEIDYERDCKRPADALFLMHRAYIEAGFTVEQAFELTKLLAASALKRPSLFG
ncbi:hypothetical protein [Streptomyces sp. S1]|uniref:hypothetical protein n=1 Tax=Streptomyces sp. S1 TaxID=718288 RepID=UPI003D705D7E